MRFDELAIRLGAEVYTFGSNIQRSSGRPRSWKNERLEPMRNYMASLRASRTPFAATPWKRRRRLRKCSTSPRRLKSWAFKKSAPTCAMFSCLSSPRRRMTASGSCCGMASKAWSTTHSSTAGIEPTQLLNRRNWYAQSGGVIKYVVRDSSRICGRSSQHAGVRGALCELLRPAIWSPASSCECHHPDRIGLAAGRGFLEGRYGPDATHAGDCSAFRCNSPVLHPRKRAWRSRVPGGASSTLSWRFSLGYGSVRGWRKADSRAWTGLLLGRGFQIRPTGCSTVSRRVGAQGREIAWTIQRHVFMRCGWQELSRLRPCSRVQRGQHQRYW